MLRATLGLLKALPELDLHCIRCTVDTADSADFLSAGHPILFRDILPTICTLTGWLSDTHGVSLSQQQAGSQRTTARLKILESGVGPAVLVPQLFHRRLLRRCCLDAGCLLPLFKPGQLG